MGEQTGIAWCDHTFNPWRGCTRVSPGCDHCYAESWSKRNPAQLGTWGDDGERVIAGEAYWRTPLRWDRLAAEAGVRRRVFCASLADVFEDRPELEEPRRRLFRLIQATQNLDWLLLTKRPEMARTWINQIGLALAFSRLGSAISDDLHEPDAPDEWPLPNVWLGVTAENQAQADERIPILLDTPAAVRFVSYEPGIGPVDFEKWAPPITLLCHAGDDMATMAALRQIFIGETKKIRAAGALDPAIDWIIVGGESGSHARLFNIQWARHTIRQCRAAGVPVFVKQMGAKPYVAPEHESGTGYDLRLRHRSGADPAEWPEELRVQEFPDSRVIT